MSQTKVLIAPEVTTLTVTEQNGPLGVVQATVQTLELEVSESVDIVEVGIQGPNGSEFAVALAKRTDFINDFLIYRGEALPGASDAAAVWRVRRLILGADDDVTEEWADGSASFNQIWDDRASLTYS